MAKLIDNFQPGFSLFPLNNNRTGYQPVNIPLLLVVPYSRDANGVPLANAPVCDLVFFIEDTPGQTPVAAPANIGVFVPGFDRFRLEITSDQLAEVRVDVTGRRFFDANGVEKTFEDAVDGDFMEYGMLRGPIGTFNTTSPGPIDTIPYYAHAEYYDLSPFIIETTDLPDGKYNFVYQARYYPRLTLDGDFVCIDTSRKVLARYASFINHPGDLHKAMIDNTPGFYFQGISKDVDPTIAFYRPFADALQDIFDEQELLKGVNHINSIPAQYIPYLAYLLGIDMPYFNTTTEDIRKALLKNGRKLQQLKGSKRAIKELFEIFGFTIDIANLWYSSDGSRFIAPNEQLPSNIEDQEITTEIVCHAEPLLTAYASSGFGQIEVPLLFKPNGNITLDGWLVEEGSAADLALQSAADLTAADVEALQSDLCSVTLQGFQSNSTLQDLIPSNGFIGHSVVLIDSDGNGLDDIGIGVEPPLSSNSLSYNSDRNSINVVFDHYLDFSRGRKLYVFATYERTKIVLPAALADLKSNRFDINIILFKGQDEQPTSDIYQFLLGFLFKFKAFHSLLRKITFAVDLEDIYNVQDFCVGGTYAQSPLIDAGQLQTLPPIIPNILSSENDIECTIESLNGGSKPADIAFRSKIISLLAEEHDAWKRLDDQYDIPSNLEPILQSASRIQFRPRIGDDCQYTEYGQDRVLHSGTVDYDHSEDDREKLCDLEGNTSDYCYRGRVGQEVTIERNLRLDEIFRCTPCELNGGIGSYFMTPLKSNNELSGGPNGDLINLTNVNNYNRSNHDRGFVRIMAFENPQIHYSDHVFVESYDNLTNNRYFATRKPSLEVVKDNMGFPGHRFISMANLGSDFTHPNYELRPWDYLFDLVCREDQIGLIIPDLEAALAVDTNGDEYIIYNSEPLIYYGNDIAADIPSMGDHSATLLDSGDVTHSIWSSSLPSLFFRDLNDGSAQYAIEESSVKYPIRELGLEIENICFSSDVSPIFSSANLDCNCDNLTNQITGRDLNQLLSGTGTGTDITNSGGADFIDGYPAEFGYFTDDLSDHDFYRNNSTDEANYALALGLNDDPITTSFVFKLGSGIKVAVTSPEYHYYKPYRLDCNCELLECEVEELVTSSQDFGFGVNEHGEFGFGGDIPDSVDENPSIVRCTKDWFRVNNTYDWNCDRVILSPTMILRDKYGANSCLMDGSIPNMMSFDDEKIDFNTLITAFDYFPQQGSYQFIDDYGVIHIGMFETADDKLDITTQVKDPRVWCVSPAGEVRNWKVFRDGVITTERQLIQVADFGFVIIAEGSEQVIDRFQTTFGCGDENYLDPFAFHLCADIVDDVEVIATNVSTGATDITDITPLGTN